MNTIEQSLKLLDSIFETAERKILAEVKKNKNDEQRMNILYRFDALEILKKELRIVASDIINKE